MSQTCDEFETFLGAVVAVNIDSSSHGFFGTVVGLSELYVTLEKRDGRTVIIRKKDISAIEAMGK